MTKEGRGCSGAKDWSRTFCGALLLLSVVLIVLSPLLFTGDSSHQASGGSHIIGYSLDSEPQGLRFEFNGLNFLFALAGSVPWLLSFLFSIPYFSVEHGHASHSEHSHPSGQSTFYVAFGLSFIFTLGVFFAADLFTAFLAFEGLGLASYLLVRHEGTREASDASDLYLYMSLAGGLLLLAGTIILKAETGVTTYEAISGLHGNALGATVILLTAGFGVKAGLIGLHIWLPRAHPVAPSPASAVLSGVMIKVGAYGILRTFMAAPHLEVYGVDFSILIAILGLANMWWGGLSALTAENLKRVMAFSSVSQMGYILLGISQATSHGHGGLLGASGALLHVLNHGLFKSLLFLVAGTLLMQEGSSELSCLRGSLRRHRWALVGFVTGSLAITGVPFLNGFASKTLIHDALLVAAHRDAGIWCIVETGFTLGSALTTLYFLRTFMILWGKRETVQGHSGKHIQSRNRQFIPAVFAVYAVLIVSIGLFPYLWVTGTIEPALAFAGFDHGELEELSHFHYFTGETVKPVAIGFALSLGVYLIFRKRLDKADPNPMLPVTDLFKTLGRPLAYAGLVLDKLLDHVYYYLALVGHKVLVSGAILEFSAQGGYHALSSSVLRVAKFMEAADRDADRAFITLNRTFELIAHFFGKVEEEDEHLVRALGRRSHSVVEAALTEEHVVDNLYRTAGRAGGNFLNLSGLIEQEAEREYVNGGRYAKSAVHRTARTVLNLRPTTPDKFWTVHPEQRQKAALLAILATVAIVVLTVVILAAST